MPQYEVGLVSWNLHGNTDEIKKETWDNSPQVSLLIPRSSSRGFESEPSRIHNRIATYSAATLNDTILIYAHIYYIQILLWYNKSYFNVSALLHVGLHNNTIMLNAFVDRLIVLMHIQNKDVYKGEGSRVNYLPRAPSATLLSFQNSEAKILWSLHWWDKPISKHHFLLTTQFNLPHFLSISPPWQIWNTVLLQAKLHLAADIHTYRRDNKVNSWFLPLC